MNAIKLNIPNATIKGQLFSHYEIEDLDQDILEVDLPNGLTIDVGWYPEYDRSGSFRIVVYRDHWRNQLREIFVNDAREAGSKVEELAREFAGTQLHVES